MTLSDLPLCTKCWPVLDKFLETLASRLQKKKLLDSSYEDFWRFKSQRKTFHIFRSSKLNVTNTWETSKLAERRWKKQSSSQKDFSLPSRCLNGGNLFGRSQSVSNRVTTGFSFSFGTRNMIKLHPIQFAVFLIAFFSFAAPSKHNLVARDKFTRFLRLKEKFPLAARRKAGSPLNVTASIGKLTAEKRQIINYVGIDGWESKNGQKKPSLDLTNDRITVHKSRARDTKYYRERLN